MPTMVVASRRARFDLTNDENVWACAVGLLAGHAYRMGMDQMVVQRYASAKTLKDAQRTALMGSVLLVVSTSLLAAVAMALVYWYRDCDPLLSGAIKNIEQLIMVVHSSASGPFIGLFVLALAFPWANGKVHVLEAMVCWREGLKVLHSATQRQARIPATPLP
ncbi:hypothetical protein HPB48_014730 [Haemaphysalis longicornis]|uniref:Uncharacterized protein n=1 Tax=Haemaphysalis longicornis TaxID=44386 RepID=A0A9J6FXB2_HAELO|nr:hypothetical protein HPB48_014730 [Haemaphysalis longicornis]